MLIQSDRFEMALELYKKYGTPAIPQVLFFAFLKIQKNNPANGIYVVFNFKEFQYLQETCF
jgi:hypothetical protein